MQAYNTHRHTELAGAQLQFVFLELKTSTRCWTEMDVFGCVIFHLLKQKGSQVVEQLITGMSQGCVERDCPVVLQEVNETISFCCVRATKYTFPFFVRIACRSATIGDSQGLFFTQ